MESLLGLVGAIAGAGIVLIGQLISRQTERKHHARDLLLENCAQALALEEEFRGRVWNERHTERTGLVASWDEAAFRSAEARVRLLTRSVPLLEALDGVRVAGQELGAAWALRSEDDLLNARWAAHRDALDHFAQVCRDDNLL